MDKTATIFVGDYFYVFGGRYSSTGRYYTTIGKLSPNGQWVEVGELQRGRTGGRVVFHEDSFLYVGGVDLATTSSTNSNTYLPTEKKRFLLPNNMKFFIRVFDKNP